MVRKTLLPIFLLTCTAIAGWGCTLNNTGEEPPEKKLYFPVALALSVTAERQAPAYLFVVNSNFDVKYNSGSVQVYDLDGLDNAVKTIVNKSPSKDAGVNGAGIIDNKDKDLFVGEVLIDSFASGIAVSPKGDRIYVPTRASANLTYINITGDKRKLLDCGQGSKRRCADDYERGDESVANERNVTMPRDPVGVVISTDPSGDRKTEEVLVAHRGGAVSLFVSDDKGTSLRDVLSDLPTRITSIARNESDGFSYLTNTESKDVETKYLVRVGLKYSSDQDPFTYLYNAGTISLNGISIERDTRGVAFYPDAFPDQAFVVTATPSALAVVNLRSEYLGTGKGLVTRLVQVGAGASRIKLGKIGEDDRLFAFVSCFDSRELYIIDVALSMPIDVVHGFSGPFEIALDSQRKYIYVADFKSSVVRIVDLTPIVCNQSEQDEECGETHIVATLGTPTPPEELL